MLGTLFSVYPILRLLSVRPLFILRSYFSLCTSSSPSVFPFLARWDHSVSTCHSNHLNQIKQPATCNLLLLLLPVLSSVCQQPLALLSLLPLLRRTLAGPQYSSLFPGGYPRFLLPIVHGRLRSISGCNNIAKLLGTREF